MYIPASPLATFNPQVIINPEPLPIRLVYMALLIRNDVRNRILVKTCKCVYSVYNLFSTCLNRKIWQIC